MSLFVYVIAVDGKRRTGLRAQLEVGTNWLVQGFATAELFLDGIDHRDPGVLLLDLSGSDAPGEAPLPVLGKLGEKFATIITISIADVSVAVAAMKAGAYDVLVLPVAPDVLMHSVEGAALMQQGAARSRAATAEGTARIAALTSREKEVFSLLADGLANRDIAACLGISLRTAEVHRARLMAKLGVGSLAQALRLGYACSALALHATARTAETT